MGAATLAPAALGIVATFIIDDLDISRATLGWVLATNVLVAAALSPIAGTMADRFGGKAAIIAVFLTSAAAFAMFGFATVIVVVFVASAVAAASQAGGNPSTNTLIGDVLAPGERGIVTGIKQSGVQASIAIAGLTLPSLAIAFGWRSGMFVVATAALLAALVALWAIPKGSHRPGEDVRDRRAVPRSVFWLAAFGGVFGFAGAVTFFVPLFAATVLRLEKQCWALMVGGFAGLGLKLLSNFIVFGEPFFV